MAKVSQTEILSPKFKKWISVLIPDLLTRFLSDGAPLKIKFQDIDIWNVFWNFLRFCPKFLTGDQISEFRKTHDLSWFDELSSCTRDDDLLP